MPVLTVADVGRDPVAGLLGRFGLEFVLLGPGQPIAGSYWGAPEAGIVGRRVYARPDTPVHSVLHEAGHTICMSVERRARLDRDAGGDDLEEAAVCYLQVILADLLEGVGRRRLMRDMDEWGYSFRLGATAAWFESDATDARDWLRRAGLIGSGDRPLFRLRGQPGSGV
ncbi:MAG: hypothetical protein R3176_00460 [Woeseiaceae bacterium]|nr:hypothetical protein [Woeseiaceae bacterium]